MILAVNEKGYWGIKLACDTCGKAIARADEGTVIWNPDPALPEIGKSVTCRLVHKGLCDDRNSYPYSNELNTCFVYWMNNLQLNLKKAQEDARLMSTL